MTSVCMWEFLPRISGKMYMSFWILRKISWEIWKPGENIINTPERIKPNSKYRHITSLKESSNVKLKARAEKTDKVKD